MHMMPPHFYRRPFFFNPLLLIVLFVLFAGWKLFLFVPLIFFALFVMKGNAWHGDNDDRDDTYRYENRHNNPFYGVDSDGNYPEKPKGKPKRGQNDDYFDDEPMIV